MTEEICGFDESYSHNLNPLTLTLSLQGRGNKKILTGGPALF
jgi:hypothetical protein